MAEKPPVIGMYLATNGEFAKPAGDLLKKCRIHFGPVGQFVK
jgi:hypothetical protein